MDSKVNQSIETQAASLRYLLSRATPSGLVRGGMVAKNKDGELVIDHLKTILKFIDSAIRRA